MTIWKPTLEPDAGPLYRQIAEALSRDVAEGLLAAGERLPTHRELARRLGVTVGTVSRAYAEAERRGLLQSRVGSGTFVRQETADSRALEDPFGAPEDSPWVDLSSNVAPPLPSSPATRRLSESLKRIAEQPGLTHLLRYQPFAGMEEHRRAGAAWIRRSGLPANPDQILVTCGTQHAMLVALSALAEPGDTVLCEELTYPGMVALADLLHLRLQGVEMDQEGLRPEALDAACQASGARALYCVPTLQNPTTALMSAERRAEVAEVARRHDLAVVEDDVHGLLPEPPPLPLAAFAPERSYYIANTSKSLAPGLRIAYLLAPAAAIEALCVKLWATTWMTPPLMAEVASRWIVRGEAEGILAARRREAAARQEIAREALAGTDFVAHPNGYHLWLRLPRPWRGEELASRALSAGVRVAPASTFAADGKTKPPRAVRICLGGAADRETLRDSLLKLALLLQRRPESTAIGIA